MSSAGSIASETGTACPIDLPHPKTEERAWQTTRQYLATHSLQISATSAILIGTAIKLLPWIHAAYTAGVNDALQLMQTALPDLPLRNLAGTNDDDNVLW